MQIWLSFNIQDCVDCTGIWSALISACPGMEKPDVLADICRGPLETFAICWSNFPEQGSKNKCLEAHTIHFPMCGLHRNSSGRKVVSMEMSLWLLLKNQARQASPRQGKTLRDIPSLDTIVWHFAARHSTPGS